MNDPVSEKHDGDITRKRFDITQEHCDELARLRRALAKRMLDAASVADDDKGRKRAERTLRMETSFNSLLKTAQIYMKLVPLEQRILSSLATLQVERESTGKTTMTSFTEEDWDLLAHALERHYRLDVPHKWQADVPE